MPGERSQSDFAKMLDVLKSGIWTPTDASGAGLALVGAVGSYELIKDYLAIVRGNLTYPATADGSNAMIGGFPFAPPVGSVENLGILVQYSTLSTLRYMGMTAGAVTASLFDASGVALTNANLSGKIVRFTACYHL